MPKIPFQTAEGSIPASAGGVYAPMNTPVEDSIFRAGQQGQQVAHEMARDIVADRRWEEHLRNAERSVKASVAENEIRSGRDKLLEGYKDDRNYGQWFDENGQISASVRSNIDALRSQYVDSITDPVLRRAVSPHFDRAAYDVERTLRVRKAQIISEDGQGQWEVMKSTAIQDYINAPTAIEKKAVFDTLQLKGLTYETQGILKPKTVERDMRMFLGKAEEAYIREVAVSDPSRAIAELSDKTRLTNLDPVGRQQFMSSLVPRAKEQQETTVYTAVMAVAGNDPEKALDIISKPEVLKQFNITTEIKDRVYASITRDATVKEAAYHRFATGKVGELSNKIYANQKVTEAEMEGLRPADRATLSRIQDYQDRQNRVDLREKEHAARQARLDAKIAAQEKSDAIEGQFRQKVYTGEIFDIMDIYKEIPNGLDPKAPDRIIAMMSKVQKDPKYKYGADVIEKAFKSGAMTVGDRGRALMDFQARVDEENATGKRIIDIAEEIVKPKKTNAIAGWLDGVWAKTKDRVKADSFFDVEPGKTVEIDGKQYKDGDEIVRDGKKFKVRVR